MSKTTLYECDCSVCGVKFTAKVARAIYCSTRCGNKVWATSRRRTQYEHICERCSKEFSGRVKDQRFCSLRCSGKHHVDRRGRPRRTYVAAIARYDELGNRLCSACRVYQSLSCYQRQATVKDGYAVHCRSCKREWNVRSKYNVSYRELHAKQDGKCAMCGESPTGRHLSVDHDHACCPEDSSCGSCVRGLLCQTCNSALGVLENQPLRARAAAYLSS